MFDTSKSFLWSMDSDAACSIQSIIGITIEEIQNLQKWNFTAKNLQKVQIPSFFWFNPNVLESQGYVTTSII